MPEAIARPEIILDEQAPPEVARRVQELDHRMHTDPKPLMDQLVYMDMRTLTPGERPSTTAVDALTPTALLTEILAQRYDAEGFDDATEAELAKDAKLKQLVVEHRKHRSIVVRKGSMTSEVIADPEAKTASNEVRRRRLGLYLGRISAYNEQQEESTERLSEAG